MPLDRDPVSAKSEMQFKETVQTVERGNVGGESKQSVKSPDQERCTRCRE